MEQMSEMLQSISSGLGPYAPRIVAAVLILVVAWLAAVTLRAVVRRAGAAARLDERLRSPGIASRFANVAYWLVWLLALPALLGALQLDGLLAPVNAMMTRLLAFVPNLLGAAIVLAIGLLVAGIVRQVVTALLAAAGSERLAARLGMASALGDGGLAGLAGLVVFALILLPVAAAALQPLGLDAVTRPVGNLLETVMALIPKLAAAAIILVVAAVIGRVVANLVCAILAGIGFDAVPARLGLGAMPRGGRSASELAGALALAAIVFLGIVQGCEILGFAVLTEAVATLGAALVKVAVGVALLGVGLWLSALAAGAIRSSSVANAPALARVARVAILFFTAALALRQMGLPAEIVTIAFASVMGAIAIGLGVAVGVGGRHVAARLLENAAASFDADRRVVEEIDHRP
jgi:hypothetical protein